MIKIKDVKSRVDGGCNGCKIHEPFADYDLKEISLTRTGYCSSSFRLCKVCIHELKIKLESK